LKTIASVLQAWARSKGGDTDNRALAIMQWMKDLQSSGVLEDVKPNAFTYSVVLASIVRSKRSDALESATELLQEMEDAVLAGDNDCRPTIVTYNTVLSSIAESGDPIKAQEFMARIYHRFESGILHQKPNIFTWNLLVEAWSRSRRPDAIKGALAAINRIRSLHASGELDQKPNFDTFKELLYCHLRSEIYNRKTILEILDEMDKLTAAGDGRISMYDQFALIRLLCEKRDSALLYRAERILETMKRKGHSREESVREAYNILISAWTQTRDPNSAERVNILKLQRNGLKIPRSSLVSASEKDTSRAYSNLTETDATTRLVRFF